MDASIRLTLEDFCLRCVRCRGAGNFDKAPCARCKGYGHHLTDNGEVLLKFLALRGVGLPMSPIAVDGLQEASND